MRGRKGLALVLVATSVLLTFPLAEPIWLVVAYHSINFPKREVQERVDVERRLKNMTRLRNIPTSVNHVSFLYARRWKPGSELAVAYYDSDARVVGVETITVAQLPRVLRAVQPDQTFSSHR